MKNKTIFFVVLMLMAGSLIGGSKVKFTQTWKNPDAKPDSWKGKKVAAFVRPFDMSFKKGAEQALARELTKRGAIGVPGHTVLPASANEDKETVKRYLQEAGVKAAVIITVVNFKNDVVGSPGQPYSIVPTTTLSGFSDFYALYGFHGPSAPATLDAKLTLIVETMLFSLEQDKLLWKGATKNANVKEIDEAVMKLAEEVGKELKKEGMVAK